MLSTAVRRGSAFSPYTSEIKFSLFGFVFLGILSTDDREKLGTFGSGERAPLITLNSVIRS